MIKKDYDSHDYYTLHKAFKDVDGKYTKIVLIITRDFLWPLGQEVTDLDEFKYGCQVNDFDFGSLRFENNEFIIKENSPEWFNYIKEPGEPEEIYMNKIISDTLKEYFGQNLEFTPIYINNLKNS